MFGSSQKEPSLPAQQISSPRNASKYYKHPEVVYLKQRLNLDQKALQESFDRLETVLDRDSIPGIPAREFPGKSGKKSSRFPGNFLPDFPGNSGNFVISENAK